jgi:hypothetical protein
MTAKLESGKMRRLHGEPDLLFSVGTYAGQENLFV